MTSEIRIETGKESRHEGPERRTCTLWGYAYEGEGARAVYYVRWNDAALEEAEFVVSVGEWGDNCGPEHRRCTCVLGRKHEGRLAFMLVDAAGSSFGSQAFLGAMLSAAQVRGTELATEVFRILDEVLVQDERVVALRARLEA